MTLVVLPERLAVWRSRPDDPAPADRLGGSLWALVRTADELSVAGPEDEAPEGVPVERGWRALKILGPLDLGLTGVLAAVAVPLADAGISIFAISTYDTDYVLVREVALGDAIAALRAAGFQIDA